MATIETTRVSPTGTGTPPPPGAPPRPAHAAGRLARRHRTGLAVGVALMLLGPPGLPAAAQGAPPAEAPAPPDGDAVELAPVPAGPAPTRLAGVHLENVVVTVTTDAAGEPAVAATEAEQDGYFRLVNRSRDELRVVITRAGRVLLDTTLTRDGDLHWLPPERL